MFCVNGNQWYNVFMAIPLDPRQAKTIALYKNPNSETFGNLKQSMIRAGYPETSTNSIYTTKPKWLTENITKQVDMIQQAEDNLQRYNSIKVDIEGDDKNAIDIAKLQIDVSKFILKTLGKGKYGTDDNSEKVPDVQINIVNYSDRKQEKPRDAEIV